MDNTKSPLKSLTIAGGGMTLLGLIAPYALQLLGVTDPGDQTFYVDAAGKVFAGIGAAIAIAGRFRATKALKF